MYKNSNICTPLCTSNHFSCPFCPSQAKHWLYHGLLYVQVPLAQVVGPVQPVPPHWPYNGAPVEDAALLVVVVVPPLLPKLNTTLYALTLNTAFVPVNGSVPAPMLVTYWLVLYPKFVARYVMKSFKSPEKLVTWLAATKE